MNDIRDLACDLDSAAGSLNCQVKTMMDIREELAHLAEDADNAPELDIRFYWPEFQRKIRLLDTLMKYNTDALVEDAQNIRYLKEGLFEKLVQKEKPSSHGNGEESR